MKVKRLFCFLLVFILMTSILAGCSTKTTPSTNPSPTPTETTTPAPSEEPTSDNGEEVVEDILSELTGYVVQIDENGRALVTSEPSTSETDENVFFQAIYFAGMPEGVEVGDKVKVSYGIVLESYPGQTKAEKAEIFESNIPDGAKKSEKEAIATALETISTEDEEGMNNFAVKSVKFNKDNSNWEVELFNIFTEETHKVEVQD